MKAGSILRRQAMKDRFAADYKATHPLNRCRAEVCFRIL